MTERYDPWSVLLPAHTTDEETNPFIPSSLHLFIHPCFHPSIHASLHPFIHPCLHSFIHLFIIYLLINIIYLLLFIHPSMPPCIYPPTHPCKTSCFELSSFIFLKLQEECSCLFIESSIGLQRGLWSPSCPYSILPVSHKTSENVPYRTLLLYLQQVALKAFSLPG